MFKLKTKLFFLVFVVMVLFPQAGFFMNEEPSWSRLNYYLYFSIEQLEQLKLKFETELPKDEFSLEMLKLALREKKKQAFEKENASLIDVLKIVNKALRKRQQQTN